MFSFIVIVYNEENTVLETLESIKYQIVNYGIDMKFQIIIADDKSKDNSRKVIDAWLDKNSNLFELIDRLYYDENLGTCKNYSRALRNIRGEQFFSISGDDIIANMNIFLKFNDLKKYDIVLNSSLLLHDKGKIEYNRKKYLTIVLQGCMDFSYIKWATKLGSPILNGAIYRKELLTEEILEYMDAFDLVDDRPRYYKMFQSNKLKLKYDNSPIILYRISDWSVSAKQGQYSERHNMDIMMLYNDILKDETNCFNRIVIKLQRISCNWRGKGYIRNKLRYFTPYYIRFFLLCVRNRKKIRNLSQELLTNYGEWNEKYYNTIKKVQ